MSDFNFDSLLAEYERKVEELNAAKKKMQDELAERMEPLFLEFFKNNPKIARIGWRQYTPYFNDGDPCVFNVYDRYFVPTNCVEEDEDCDFQEFPSMWSATTGFYDSDIKQFKAAGLTDGEIKKVEEFGKFLMNIPDNIYEGIYGEHATVVATANGVESEWYDHD